MMNWKQAGIGLAIAAALVGCNGNNDKNKNDVGMDNQLNDHRYNNNLNDDGMMRDDTTRYKNDMRGTDTMDRDNRRDGVDNHMDNDDNRYNLSKKSADRIKTEVQGIDGAKVLTTGNTAYVAAYLDTDNSNGRTAGELTDAVKKRIKDIVQSEEPNIDRVYVSTNPDFTNLMDRYSDNVKNGRPVAGFFDEVGNTIKRIFPQNK